MAGTSARQLPLANSKRSGLFSRRMGSNLALALYVATSQVHPSKSVIPSCRDRLYGKQCLPLSSWRSASFLCVETAGERGNERESCHRYRGTRI